MVSSSGMCDGEGGVGINICGVRDAVGSCKFSQLRGSVPKSACARPGPSEPVGGTLMQV